MSRQYTEAEITMSICFATMTAWQFSTERRREWTIWAAMYRRCEQCGVEPLQLCINLADKRAHKTPRTNRHPHGSRIDWEKFLWGLKHRGYYRPAIEAQVRKYAVTGSKAPEMDIRKIDDRPEDMPDWAK